MIYKILGHFFSTYQLRNTISKIGEFKINIDIDKEKQSKCKQPKLLVAGGGFEPPTFGL